jgi:hypothetical protein
MWHRRQAAQRMEPLNCPGRCRDPLRECRCEPPPPRLSERMIDAGADAAIHILAVTGCTPILKLDTLRALCRRGGDDHALAQELYELVGGDAG